MENQIKDTDDKIVKNELDMEIKFKNIIKFVFPTIVSMIFMSLYAIVDGFCVSKFVGTNALSAINIVMPILFIMMAVGTMFGTGGSAIVAKKMGENKNLEAKENFSLIVFMSLLLGIISTIVSLIFLDGILSLLGTTDILYNDAKEYLKVALIFNPIIMIAMIFETFFIVAGKAHLGLFFSVTGGIVNIILDFLFIGQFGWGAMGASLASSIGYSIPGIIGLFYFTFYRKGTLYLIKPKLDMKILLKSVSNGASEMITNLSTSIVGILMNLTLLKIAGEDGVAAITIILYGQMILSGVFMGYSMGMAPIISYNYGEKNTVKLSKIVKHSMKFILIFAIIAFVVGQLIDVSLVKIFAKPGTNVFELATSGFRLFSISFIFMGIGIFTSSLFTALSNGKVSAIIAFFRTLVFISTSIIILPRFIGISGVWLAIPVAEILASILSIFFIRKYKNQYGY